MQVKSKNKYKTIDSILYTLNIDHMTSIPKQHLYET